MNMMVRPLSDRIVVKRAVEETKTAGGLFIPDSAKKKPVLGTVEAVGPGTMLADGKLKPMDVKKDDVVLFGEYSGTPITVNGEELVILRETDVLGIMN